MGAITTTASNGVAETRGFKRQKISDEAPRIRSSPGASRIFAPYRTVGLVSPTSVPFVSVPLGKTTFQITTSVGYSLQTYDLRRGLNLVFITRPQTPQAITASAAWKGFVLAAWGGEQSSASRGVWAFRRGKKEAELELPRGFMENVKSFCIFGTWIVGVCDTQLLVWKCDSFELYTSIQGISQAPFTGSVSNLPTFLNKIVAGRQDGSVEIWNVSSGRLVYTILPPTTEYGAVTAIEPTPVLSLVAIAYENSLLILHDVRADETVLELQTPVSAPVTSISFRTDGIGAGEDGRKAGVMATSSTVSGDITLWNLNQGGSRAGVLRAAHGHPTNSSPGGVGKIEFLYGQSILVSNGLDNSLKTWIFDQTPFSPIPRILHARSGHGAPVTKMEFLPSGSDGAGDIGKWLMSASVDRSLWGWSLRRDGQSTELSQGALQKKAKKQGHLSEGGQRGLEDLKCPPIIAIACSLNRDGGIGAVPGKHPIWQNKRGKNVDAELSSSTGWESVVTAHQSSSKVRTWFWGRKRAGRWAFDTSDSGDVSAVTVSACGSFALLGSAKGAIDMFNLQSGVHRQRFPPRLTVMQVKQLKLDIAKHGLIEEEDKKQNKFYRGQGRHRNAVIGLAVDSLNKTVISAGADGIVNFWDFSNGLLKHQLNWGLKTDIIGMRFHKNSELVGFSCSDGCIRVVDITTYRLIRELWITRMAIPQLQDSKITDFCFSNDGLWIIACTGQLVVLWDLPTGHLVDAFKLKADCTSIAFSPTGEYLATATTSSVGVDVWSNKALFSHVPTRHIGPQELRTILLGKAQGPSASGEDVSEATVGTSDGDDHDGYYSLTADADPQSELEQISADMLSLSLVPRSRWQNLLHLDLIRQRNKPVEPPKKPEKAPFFLPSLNSTQNGPAPMLNGNAVSPSELEAEKSRFLKLEQLSSRNAFSYLLQHATTKQDFPAFLDHLKSLNPSSADIEIRSLSVENDEMRSFVQALTWLLRERRDFELGQAWMAVFLRIHGDAVVGNAELREAVAEWQRLLQEEKMRVMSVVGYCSGVVGWLRAARV